MRVANQDTKTDKVVTSEYHFLVDFGVYIRYIFANAQLGASDRGTARMRTWFVPLVSPEPRPSDRDRLSHLRKIEGETK